MWYWPDSDPITEQTGSGSMIFTKPDSWKPDPNMDPGSRPIHYEILHIFMMIFMHPAYQWLCRVFGEEIGECLTLASRRHQCQDADKNTIMNISHTIYYQIVACISHDLFFSKKVPVCSLTLQFFFHVLVTVFTCQRSGRNIPINFVTRLDNQSFSSAHHFLFYL